MKRSAKWLGFLQVTIRHYFSVCAGVPGFERANHLSARKEFHTAALEFIESDCEHMRDISQYVLIKGLLT